MPEGVWGGKGGEFQILEGAVLIIDIAACVQILMAKVHEKGPVLVLAFHSQQLTRKLGKDGGVEDVSATITVYPHHST
jgi:hypothetical protein